MNISGCEHPRLITDPHTGDMLRVRCGHCNSCLNSKAKSWVSRLIEESRHHRYAFMVNLTYDDAHLPKMKLDDSGNLRFINRSSDIVIPAAELNELIDKSDNPERERKYMLDRSNHSLGIPAVCVKDLQLFNKRLNKYLFYNVTFSFSNFRYFIAFEYGPGTYRPHMHCVYFFDRPEIEPVFDKVIHKTWSNGDTSTDNIFSNGGFSYVAQYVNMSCHLPAIYAHKNLKQRHIFSKSPVIGSPLFLDEEIRDVYDRKPIKRTVFDPLSGKYSNIPVSPAYKNRFFPKCFSYSRIPDSYRITLYRLCEIFPSENFDEFSEAVYSFYSFGKLPKVCPPEVRTCLFGFVRSLDMHCKRHDLVNAKMYRAYLVSKRYIYLRDTLRFSDTVMLREINDYYKKFDYEKLKDFYSFQEDYVKLHPLRDLIHMYPEFADYYLSRTVNNLSGMPDYLRLALFSFGLDWYDDKKCLEDSYDYKNLVQRSDKIYKDTHKAHDVHNYRYSKRFHDINPTLQKIIQDYDKLCVI